MALLFIYDRSKDSFSESIGLDRGTWVDMHKKLLEMVMEDINLFYDDKEKDEAYIVQSRLEYAQALAEYLGRDLTPELGLLIGFVTAEAGKMTEQIMNHNGMGKSEQSE